MKKDKEQDGNRLCCGGQCHVTVSLHREYPHMLEGRKTIWMVLSVGFVLIGGAGLTFLGHKTMGLPFRETNDMLHKTDSPVTLDFLIPGGIHIDAEITIGGVVQRRFQGPGNRLAVFMAKISQSVPARYRYTATALLYFFWTALFLVFFRIFTWMAYASALRVSFLCGGTVYFFMPDFVVGRLDDTAFLLWPVALFVTARCFRRRKAARSL